MVQLRGDRDRSGRSVTARERYGARTKWTSWSPSKPEIVPSAVAPVTVRSKAMSGWVDGFTWQPVAEQAHGVSKVQQRSYFPQSSGVSVIVTGSCNEHPIGPTAAPSLGSHE